MKVLIAFEYSGVVRDAFKRKGHKAISCDILATEKPGRHHKGDIIKFLKTFPDQHFDLIIMHPPCTALAVSGNAYYGEGKTKYKERLKSIRFIKRIWRLAKKKGKRVCLENPIGVIPTHTNLPKPSYVQPYNFGEDASKNTGLYLHNLKPLKPTKYIEPRYVCCGEVLDVENLGIYGCLYCCGDKTPLRRWSNQTNSGQSNVPPSENRGKDKAKTYKGIARAIAKQWSF